MAKKSYNKNKKLTFALLCLSLLSIPFASVQATEKTEDVVYLLPNANGALNQWNIFPATVSARDNIELLMHWDKVDDPIERPDEDRTYVYTNGMFKIEDFNHETSDLLEGVTITNVRVVARMKSTGVYNAIVNIGLKLNGIRFPARNNEMLTANYANYCEDWAYNPLSLTPDTSWTKADIDDLQTSLKSTSIPIGTMAYCTQIYLIVSYTS